MTVKRMALVALGLLMVGVGGAACVPEVFSPHKALRAFAIVGIALGMLALMRGLERPLGKDEKDHHVDDSIAGWWSVREAFGAAFAAFPVVGLRMAGYALLAALLQTGAQLGARAVVGSVIVFGPGGRGVALSPTPWTAVGGMLGGLLVANALGSFFHAAMLRLALPAVLGRPTAAPLRSASYYAVRVFGANLLGLLGIGLSFPAFSLLGFGLLLTPYFVVDRDLPLGEAALESLRFGWARIGKLILLSFAMLPLHLLGASTVLLQGLAGPISVLALAFVYARSTGRLVAAGPPVIRRRSRLGRRRLMEAIYLFLAFVFAGLVLRIEGLPTMRGTAFNVVDMLVRAAAIVVGTGAVALLLALLLPHLLDLAEGNRFTTFVAARHVRSQKSGFLTVISVLSICGVAISSCALSSVVSVMGGFSQDLKRKILGNNAHIVIDTTAAVPFADYEAALTRVRGTPGVVGAAPVVNGEVMASSASNLAGVMVAGIQPGSIRSVIDLAHNIEVGKLDYLEHPEHLTRLPANEVIGLGPGGEQYFKGADLPGLPDDIDPAVRAVIINKADRPGIILGRELAKTLHVYVGDEITLVSPLGDLGPMGIMPRTKKFRVAAIFYSGMYEYDAMKVYTMIDVAQEYFQTGDKISSIEVKVEEAERADAFRDGVETSLARPDLRVRDWREINKNLFSALKLERFATFVILSIAIMVASFCIVCTLLLMVTEKGKEIAILKAIGASDGAILRTFIIEGMIIGGIGTAFGVVTGLAACTGLAWFGLRLDPDVYYIDRLPISVNGTDFLAVAVSALVICTLSTLYPAYAASRLRPVDGLRNE